MRRRGGGVWIIFHLFDFQLKIVFLTGTKAEKIEKRKVFHFKPLSWFIYKLHFAGFSLAAQGDLGWFGWLFWILEICVQIAYRFAFWEIFHFGKRSFEVWNIKKCWSNFMGKSTMWTSVSLQIALQYCEKFSHSFPFMLSHPHLFSFISMENK